MNYSRVGHVINADGSDQVRLTSYLSSDGAPCWSPDGTRIVFSFYRIDNYDIYVLTAGETEPVQLADDAGNDMYPRWSPDGERIVFTSDRAGNDDIYVMNADGSGVQQLTDDAADDAMPAWRPVVAENRKQKRVNGRLFDQKKDANF